jgi:hypothetical protein
MSKLKQTTIPVIVDEDNLMKVALEQGIVENEFNWKLVRERDNLTNKSKEIVWLEWTENGRFKAKHTDIAVGRSLLMSPFNEFYTWQTTVVTEILERRDGYIKFRTSNSVYELTQILD